MNTGEENDNHNDVSHCFIGSGYPFYYYYTVYNGTYHVLSGVYDSSF